MKNLTDILIEYKIVHSSSSTYKLNVFKFNIKYFEANNLEQYIDILNEENLFKQLLFEDSILLRKHNSYIFKQQCEVCSAPTIFIGWKYGYKKYCCKECEWSVRKLTVSNRTDAQKEETNNKRKKTKLDRYGDENYNNVEQIVKTQNEIYGGTFNSVKSKQTKLERYGDENYNNTTKQQQTMLELYGSNTALKIPEMRNEAKAKESCLERYGVEFPLLNTEIKNKALETKLLKYGNEKYTNPNKQKETKLNFDEVTWSIIHNKRFNTIEEKYGTRSYINLNKVKETSIERYGVENYSQLGITQNGYKWKEYTLPSGEIIHYQGYEHKLLDELLLEYSEDDIVVERRNMPEIWYIGTDNKQHRYFPDIYIPSTNTIYEVKSDYTLNLDLETNLLKFQAVKDSGYNFILKVY